MNFSQLQGERYKRLPMAAQIIRDCKVTHLLMLSMFSVLISDLLLIKLSVLSPLPELIHTHAEYV